MRDIGILNLTRFGDLIQTTPVLNGLRKRYPDARIHLIIKSRFRNVVPLLPELDQVHEIDGDALAETLSNPGTPFLERFRQVRDLIYRLRETHFDVVINYTHSRTSAVLLSLLNSDETIGFQLDRSGQRSIDDPWLGHMSTLVTARQLSRFNLVDIYLGGARLTGCREALSAQIPESAHGLTRERLPQTRPLVAVQLAGSTNTRSWTVDRYAATLKQLFRQLPELQLVLVGVRSEQEVANRFKTTCPEIPIHDLVGSTEVDELAAVLARVDLLLTGDTGTMHLAAAVGTPTCAVFMGLASPHETCVYAEGHWVVSTRIPCWPCSHIVQCGYPVCHDDIPADWLAALLQRILQGLPVDDLPLLPQADLFRTRFDSCGLLEAVPLLRRAPDAQDLLSLGYRAVFLESFCGIPVDIAEVLRRASEYYEIEPHEWKRVMPVELPAQLARIEQLSDEAQRMAGELLALKHRPQALKEAGDLLHKVDEEIYSISRAQALLAPLGYSLEAGLENLPDAELPTVGQISSDHYRNLYRRASVLDRLIHNRPPSKLQA